MGDLVRRLISSIAHIGTLIIPIVYLRTKSPDPASKLSTLNPNHYTLRGVRAGLHEVVE